MSKIPWVEYYRPSNFNDIVLDDFNKQILSNIIDTSYFPNLLLYGPPGTGKTTTIINLIDAYQNKLGKSNKDLIIHLNASDERGIDIIRNQISNFVNSKPLFNLGMKFVILDEVDYMTKNAQQALKYLLQSDTYNVRFCLICNYISKIDEGLQNEFIKLRFNQLPRDRVIDFLKKITVHEQLNLDDNYLSLIQQIYKSDIRSMVNFLQSNQIMFECKNEGENKSKINIINDTVWNTLIHKIQNSEKLDQLVHFIYTICISYNIDTKNVINNFLNYLIRNKCVNNKCKFLEFVENLLHSQITNNNLYIRYALTQLSNFI